jgi:hypothetical protein
MLRRCVLRVATAGILVLASSYPSLVAAEPEGSTPQREIRWGPEMFQHPREVTFPSTRAGWAEEKRLPWDVSPYLAYHKAEQLRRWRAMREEPTPNQSLWDAGYYDLDLTLDPQIRLLEGTVTMRATVLTGPLTEVDLDLASNLTVSSVTSGGVPALYTHANDILTVTLDRAYATGEVFEIVVTYSGDPGGGAFGWDSFGGQPMIWTLSEPYGARTWWPCKDYPYDKADSVDIRVQVPSGLIVASNGTLREAWDDGTTSFAWWHEGHAITTYLVSLAIHPYAVSTDWYVSAANDSMPLVFYDFPAHQGDNQPVQSKVKDMIAAYAGLFGEYPFLDEKYGHAEFLWGGGMEHQTLTSLGYYGESVVAHELGHQWFGDMVTCRSFHHIWLNEGFATYTEALWFEQAYGPDAYWQDIMANQYFGGGTIYVPDTSDEGRIFHSGLSYNKASWVLHMLRHVVGDSTFFEVLRTYGTTFRDSVATTEDFQAVAESVSGKDLDAFFQQWIYGEYYPIYSYDWSAQPAGGGWDLELTIEQVQDWQVFSMPVDVLVHTTAGDTLLVVENTQALQVYQLHVANEPTGVELDPEHWILRVVLAPVPPLTFERPLLLVNGVDWQTYGNEIRSAYEDRAFWGPYEIDFWDYFPEPPGGYPSTLPAPLGHGAVDPDTLAKYANVIWVGNNYNGDLNGWLDSPMYAYLRSGGNVLLMTRRGNTFLLQPFLDYLGIQILGTGSVYDCIAVDPNLVDMDRIGTQSWVTTFDTTVGPDSRLLFEAQAGFNPPRGLGVIATPQDQGVFAFLSGRPYRWDHQDLRDNVAWLLEHDFQLGPSAGPEPTAATPTLVFSRPRPNPFPGEVVFSFRLGSPQPVQLRIWDVAGRQVVTLLDGRLEAGTHRVRWDGRDAQGRPVPAGAYFFRLNAGDRSRSGKVMRLR